MSSLTLLSYSFFLFFFNDTATTDIYTLSLHDALPIWKVQILTVMEQRSKFGGKPQQAAIAKRAKLQLKKKHGTSKITKKS